MDKLSRAIDQGVDTYLVLQKSPPFLPDEERDREGRRCWRKQAMLVLEPETKLIMDPGDSFLPGWTSRHRVREQ